MNNPLGVSPSKGNQGTTRGKEKIFWPRFANENLLCGFSACKSQYVYNKAVYPSMTFEEIVIVMIKSETIDPSK